MAKWFLNHFDRFVRDYFGLERGERQGAGSEAGCLEQIGAIFANLLVHLPTRYFAESSSRSDPDIDHFRLNWLESAQYSSPEQGGSAMYLNLRDSGDL